MAGRDAATFGVAKGPLPRGDAGTRPPRCGDGATASPPCTCHGVLPWELPAQPLPGQPRSLACAWGCVRNVSPEEGEEGGTGTLSVPVAALNKALSQRGLAGGAKRAALGTGCPPVHPQPLCPSLGVPRTGDMFVPPSSRSSRALLACRGLGESQPGAATVWGGLGAYPGDHPAVSLVPITLPPPRLPSSSSPHVSPDRLTPAHTPAPPQALPAPHLPLGGQRP